MSYSGASTKRTTLLNVDLTSKYLLLTIHETPKKQLDTLQLTMFGMTRATEAQVHSKRLALFESKEFQLNLLEVCQSASTSSDLRNLCLELLWTAWTGSNK